MTVTSATWQHYAPDVPTSVDVPNTDLYELLASAARSYPDRVATDFLGATLTYRQLHQRVLGAAEVLRRMGVEAGSTVAVIAPNCPQHVVVFYALARLGAVVAEHNPLAPTQELEDQIRRHGAQVVIAWEPVVARLAQEHPAGVGRTYVSIDLTASMPKRIRFALKLPLKAARQKRAEMRAEVPLGTIPLDEMIEGSLPLTESHPRPVPSDLAVLLHTGGTTGSPKAVMLTHANLVANATQGAAWLPGLSRQGEVFLAVLPFFHAFGLTLNLTFGISSGATLLILPRFDVELTFSANQRRPITFLPAVPPILDRLEAALRDKPQDFSACRITLVGAMSLPKEVAERWEKVTGHEVIEGYGMTECSPVILGNPVSEKRRPGALGLAFPSTEVRIVDPENPTVDVADGEEGELIVRGPQVCAGYLNEPEESADLFTSEGWLRTGDIVRLDDGFIVMADRRKELIISGGFNIYPSQVENAVRSMPGVVDVAVVGMPAGSLGEQVMAALVLEPGKQVSLEEVRAWAEKSLSHYALPRQIAVLTELPRSQIGKVLRRSVKEQLLSASSKVTQAAQAAGQAASQAAHAATRAAEHAVAEAKEKLRQRSIDRAAKKD
ncbi:AMP-binding protein [Buchananella felis]|uniref:AMP-binding protein n=1 Tax=Buchananella felis TaxID=3231492 RepID=UPI00352917C3